MRGAIESRLEQQAAVHREHDRAIADGATEKAKKIRAANPDMDFTTKPTEA